MITPRKDPPPLWQEFLDLDPEDAAAVERFIQTHYLIDWLEPRLPGGGVTEDIPMPWHLSPLARPSKENLMPPKTVPDLHRTFAGAVQDCRRCYSADKREAWSSDLLYQKFDLLALVNGLNAEMQRTHPRLVIDDDGKFALQLPGSAKGYTSMADIYFSFVQDLTLMKVATCAYCGKLFGLSPKQRPAQRRERRLFCTPLHRLQFFESKPQRKKQKADAVKRFRDRNGKLTVKSKRTGGRP